MAAEIQFNRIFCASKVAKIALGFALVFVHLYLPLYAANTAEIVDRTSLRVCGDPNNLPFSNDKGEGFENKIAELLAEYLGTPIDYTWFPQSQGFIRATLKDYKCDIVMGISAAHGLVLNTNPYYSSVFVLIYRKDQKNKISTLADPELKKFKKIGLVAGTSPTELMLKHGLITQMAPYHLYVDTRVNTVGSQMIQDILDKKLDAGILWGPIAGFYASQHAAQLEIVPLTADDTEELRVVYRITMGVRPGEVEWKRLLNTFMKEKKLEIEQILEGYGVPLVDK